MNIDLFNLKKELDYFCEYYGTDFIEGLGTEKILDCFDKYFVKAKWLDLGGGSTSLLWWLAQKYNNAIDIVDISEESFILTKIIQNTNYDKGCYKYVKNYFYNKNLRDCKINFLKKDLFTTFSLKNKYKNISQIGLLGLCKDKDQFNNTLTQICNMLKNDGILISANWIFNKTYSVRKNIDNTYITEDFIKQFTIKNHLLLKYCKFIEFPNDNNYKGVLIYVIQKKKDLAKSY